MALGNLVDTYFKPEYNELLSNLSGADNLSIVLSNISEQMDSLPENFVRNGTLVIRMNRLVNFGLEPKFRIGSIKKINEYIKNIEMEISCEIGIKVRFLFNDISILERK